MPPTIDLQVPVTARDHCLGNEHAPLTLVEYGDFECPYCGAAFPILRSLRQELGADLRFVFRNFPLAQMHPSAELAAEAAEAAGAQGRYWEMHDLLFESQSALGLEHILGLAASLKLDEDRFILDLKERKFLRRVRDDFMGGARSGVNGTPGFFVNGTRYPGSWEKRALLAALRGALPARRAG